MQPLQHDQGLGGDHRHDAGDARHYGQHAAPARIFPDYMAPIVRNAPDSVRELTMARWGMPGPPQFGGAPITNIRNTKSPHWRRWLTPGYRSVVPWSSICEYADTKPRKTPTWFALDESRPLAFFARIWTEWEGKRGTKANPIEGKHTLFGFLTTTERCRGADPSEGDAGHLHDAGGGRALADGTERSGSGHAGALAGWHAQNRGAGREGRRRSGMTDEQPPDDPPDHRARRWCPQ